MAWAIGWLYPHAIFYIYPAKSFEVWLQWDRNIYIIYVVFKCDGKHYGYSHIARYIPCAADKVYYM